MLDTVGMNVSVAWPFVVPQPSSSYVPVPVASAVPVVFVMVIVEFHNAAEQREKVYTLPVHM